MLYVINTAQGLLNHPCGLNVVTLARRDVWAGTKGC